MESDPIIEEMLPSDNYQLKLKTHNIITIEKDLDKHMYRLDYRCNNCGTVFEFDMRKGTPTMEMRGTCPYCGARSGQPNTGVFEAIKKNNDLDKPFNPHTRPLY